MGKIYLEDLTHDEIKENIVNEFITIFGRIDTIIVDIVTDNEIFYNVYLGEDNKTANNLTGQLSIKKIPKDKNSLLATFTMMSIVEGKKVYDTLISSILHIDDATIFYNESDTLIDSIATILMRVISSHPMAKKVCSPITIQYDNPATRKYNTQYIRSRSISKKIHMWLCEIEKAFNNNDDNLIAKFRYTLQNSEGDYLINANYTVTIDELKGKRVLVGELSGVSFKGNSSMIAFSSPDLLRSEVEDIITEPLANLIKKLKCPNDTLTREFYIMKERNKF